MGRVEKMWWGGGQLVQNFGLGNVGIRGADTSELCGIKACIEPVEKLE